MDTAATAQWLLSHDRYLILTHRRPDGDAIGSAAGLARGLRSAGKTAYILRNPETTPRYEPFARDYLSPEGFEPDTVVTVDTASVEMFQRNAAEYGRRVDLCIDHHPSNTGYAAETCLEPGRAACGEIILDILSNWQDAVDAETARALYVAVSTDTGCFSYGNTTADTLLAASRLARAGANIGPLNKTLFREKTRARATLEGMIFTGMQYHFDTVAIATVTLDMLARAGAGENDLDDLASLPGSIEGVGVGITIRELSAEDGCKVSVRSGPDFNSNALCARFGGGGHAMAAGFTSNADPRAVRDELLAALREIFGET
jgi:phosphoesterase RecJ-like protein